MDQLKQLIREVPDFPKPGILFYDITTSFETKRTPFEAERGGAWDLSALRLATIAGVKRPKG